MNRRIIALRSFLLALVGAQIFLSLLPSLGWIWHSVLPEHEHWFVGTLHEDSYADARLAPNDCAACNAAGETTLHVPSFSAFQIAAIAVGFVPALILVIPPEFVARVAALWFNFTSPNLPRLDPPPKNV